MIAVCGSVFLAMAGETLVAFWTRGKVLYDAGLMVALLAYGCSQAHWFTSSVLLSACGRQKTVLQYSTISGLTGFVLGGVLAGQFGLVGFVWGLVAADFGFSSMILPILACRIIGESLRRFFREVSLRGVLLFVALYAGMRFLLPLVRITQNYLGELLSVAFVTVALGLSGAYAMSLNRHERARLNAAIAGMLAR